MEIQKLVKALAEDEEIEGKVKGVFFGPEAPCDGLAETYQADVALVKKQRDFF